MIQFILRHVNYSACFSLENSPRMGLKSALAAHVSELFGSLVPLKNLPFFRFSILPDFFWKKSGTE